MAEMTIPPLILGSASPRRQELMRAAGFTFSIHVSAAEELHDARFSPEELTILNALRKAKDIASRHPECLVLGADTLVYLEGEPLGKPADLQDAAHMLKRLSGRVHRVCTGVGLVRNGVTLGTDAVITQVQFGTLDDQLIARYHSLVNPLDKAGAYGFQQHAEMLQAEIDGPADNVIGLPMDAVKKLLSAHGHYSV